MAWSLSRPQPMRAQAQAQVQVQAHAQALARRSTALAERFADIARTQMAGLPLLHPGLRVQALGFALAPPAPEAADAAPAASGILLTPWFMNLVWLPLTRQEGPQQAGQRRERRLGTQRFEFLTAWDPVLGAYESCSLFSPMQDFVDHAAAQATAHEVLRLLRDTPSTPGTPAASAPDRPARRAFLTGRRAGA